MRCEKCGRELKPEWICCPDCTDGSRRSNPVRVIRPDEPPTRPVVGPTEGISGGRDDPTVRWPPPSEVAVAEIYVINHYGKIINKVPLQNEKKKIWVGREIRVVETKGSGLAVIRVDNQFVSREHALISKQEDGSYRILDLMSLGGTTVGDISAEKPIQLKDGDRIHLGREIELEYREIKAQQRKVSSLDETI